MARILVVDDNAENAYMLEVLLNSHGHEAETAANGAEALDRARSRPPDLIVSDILMPVMDGFALCREWKADPHLRNIPFLIYTATFVDRKDEELALSLGADRFIVKPQEPDILLGIILELLEEHSPHSPKKTPRKPSSGEAEAYREYSDTLFRKLEKKMADLEKANEALKISEARYRIVAENTSTWEFWISETGEMLYVSPSCRRITGRDPGDFQSDPNLLLHIIHPDDLQRFKAHRKNVTKRKDRGEIEFRILDFNGETRWIAHECLPVYDDEGRFRGTRGSNRDITARKQLEEQLLHSQKMEAFGLLAGGIAHDFNNILTAIIGFGNLLQLKMAPNDPQRKNLDQLLASAERAVSLVRSLLAFGRKQEMKAYPVDLNHLAQNVERLLRRIIGEDVRMEIRLRPGGVRINADHGQIEQVMLNLATNARDAMPNGGHLAIDTDIVEKGEPFHSILGPGAPGRYGVLSMSDDGMGMDESVREKIFEPFFSTKETGKGSGLGLSIVYGIVSQHGGHIEMVTEKGRGTTIRILLPLCESGAETPAAAPAKDAWPPGKGEIILVAEDDEMIRSFTETMLNTLGYEPCMTTDGEAAVEAFRRRHREISLVLLDMIMPKKNGKEAFGEIRAIRPDAKVLFASGYPQEIIESKGLAVEGVEFMRKPYSPGDLARKLREMLDR